MNNHPDFKRMSPQEQNEWVAQFRSWTNSELTLLYGMGNAWNSESIATLERGLHLMTAFPFCRDFVADSFFFRDFSRRMNRIQYYIDKINKEITVTLSSRGVTEESIYASGNSSERTGRKRGRPTRAESARMAREREAQAALFPSDGTTCSKEDALPETARNVPEESKPEGKKEDTPSDAGLSAAIAVSLANGDRLHIDQLSWLLTPALRESVKNISTLRNIAAMESNKAKELARQSADVAVIEPHSRASVEATTDYKAIYSAIDDELGILYATLFGSAPSNDITYEYGLLCSKKGIDFSTLRKILKPYWEKIGSPDTVAVVSRPVEDEEDAERKAERQARMHRIRTYFMRKDMQPSQKRVEKMRELIEEVRSYGLPADEYEVVLKKTEEELKGLSEGEN